MSTLEFDLSYDGKKLRLGATMRTIQDVERMVEVLHLARTMILIINPPVAPELETAP